ncbi:MAG: hypothetical protein HY363_04485 [Candidatus Aenigmarchaeota archaeon]|nr:hypothetical protein [Candidatus Aenigmarchaeota archaeon]
MNKKAMETAYIVEIVLVVVVIIAVAVGIILKLPELAKKAEPTLPCPSNAFDVQSDCTDACPDSCAQIENTNCWKCQS